MYFKNFLVEVRGETSLFFLVQMCDFVVIFYTFRKNEYSLLIAHNLHKSELLTTESTSWKWSKKDRTNDQVKKKHNRLRFLGIPWLTNSGEFQLVNIYAQEHNEDFFWGKGAEN